MGQVRVVSRVERWVRRGRRDGSLVVVFELPLAEWGFCSQWISESSSSSSSTNGADAVDEAEACFFVGAICVLFLPPVARLCGSYAGGATSNGTMPVGLGSLLDARLSF